MAICFAADCVKLEKLRGGIGVALGTGCLYWGVRLLAIEELVACCRLE